jgi:hypothetical protein
MGARGPVSKSIDHGNAGFGNGLPEMPPGLTDAAKKIWRFVCEQIPPERSCPGDALLMAGLARWFAHWDRLMTKVEEDPTDWRMQKQATGAWEKVDQSLRQMGLTLVSRARLPAGTSAKQQKQENPILQIVNMREGKRKPG